MRGDEISARQIILYIYIYTREAKDETQKCHPERIKTGPSNIIGRSDAESKKRAAPRAHTLRHKTERARKNSIISWVERLAAL
jgi:hypothetical protein